MIVGLGVDLVEIARVRDLARIAGVDEDQVIPFSAVTGLGRADLAEAILGLVTRDAE